MPRTSAAGEDDAAGAVDWLTRDLTILGMSLAFVLGALVGAKREWRQNAAGLRSCVLAPVAAAAFNGLMVTRVSPSGLGSGFGAIATGVGFLGAYAIIKEGANARGLSTAATIWCAAAIGTQAGAQETVAAIWLTTMVLAVNLVLKPAQWLIRRARPRHPSAEDVALES